VAIIPSNSTMSTPTASTGSAVTPLSEPRSSLAAAPTACEGAAASGTGAAGAAASRAAAAAAGGAVGGGRSGGGAVDDDEATCGKVSAATANAASRETSGIHGLLLGFHLPATSPLPSWAAGGSTPGAEVDGGATRRAAGGMAGAWTKASSLCQKGGEQGPLHSCSAA